MTYKDIVVPYKNIYKKNRKILSLAAILFGNEEAEVHAFLCYKRDKKRALVNKKILLV